jgi:hypothetical protein
MLSWELPVVLVLRTKLKDSGFFEDCLVENFSQLRLPQGERSGADGSQK